MDLAALFDTERRRMNHQPGSIAKTRTVITAAETWIGHDLTEATTDDLRGWLDTLNIRPVTMNAYIAHLSSFYKWAVKERHLSDNPAERLSRPKQNRGIPRPIGHTDLAHAVELADTETAAMILLAAMAGFRCIEIAGLNCADLYPDGNPPTVMIAHGKGDKARNVPMAPEVVAALDTHGTRTGPVFHRDGEPYPAYAISHKIRNHLHACGIHASAHKLRHTFATAVYNESGGDLRMTQELLGHASPATTAIYTQWNQDKAATVINNLYRTQT